LLAAQTKVSRSFWALGIEAMLPLSVNEPPAMASVGHPISAERRVFPAAVANLGCSSIRYCAVLFLWSVRR